MITFQREAPTSWRKMVLGLEDLHLRGRGRIYNFKFSEVNALKKGRSGAYSQKEIWPKFSRLRGVLKPSWSLWVTVQVQGNELHWLKSSCPTGSWISTKSHRSPQGTHPNTTVTIFREAHSCGSLSDLYKIFSPDIIYQCFLITQLTFYLCGRKKKSET